MPQAALADGTSALRLKTREIPCIRTFKPFFFENITKNQLISDFFLAIRSFLR